jgi:hypothetical protein
VLRFELTEVEFLVKIIRRGQGVITVQSPWKNQAKKNLNGLFFITSKRLSHPFSSTLLNKKVPNLKAQIAMSVAAIFCLLLRLLLK